MSYLGGRRVLPPRRAVNQHRFVNSQRGGYDDEERQQDSDDGGAAGMRAPYPSPAGSVARSSPYYGPDTIMAQASMAAQHSLGWPTEHTPLVVAAGRPRDLPVCPMWVGAEHNEKSFAEWYDMEFTENVVRSLHSPNSEEIFSKLKHYLNMLDPNVKAALEVSVLKRRGCEAAAHERAATMVAERRQAQAANAAQQHAQAGQHDPEEALPEPETATAAQQAEARIFAEARDATYRVQLDSFRAEMEKVTALDVHERLWTCITRAGFYERPATFATRMHRAHAKVHTSTIQDLNRRFTSRVLEPWEKSPGLRSRRQHHLEFAIDPETRCSLDQLSRDRHTDRVDDIARIVEKIEREQQDREADNALAMERVAQIVTDSDMSMLQAALDAIHPADMEVREGREGRNVNGQFRPRCDECAALHIPDPYHTPRFCPLRARDRKRQQQKQQPTGRANTGTAGEADSMPDAGKAQPGKGNVGKPTPHARAAADGKRQAQPPAPPAEAVCWNCGRPDADHKFYVECDQPLSPQLLKRFTFKPADQRRRTEYLAKIGKPQLDRQRHAGTAAAAKGGAMADKADSKATPSTQAEGGGQAHYGASQTTCWEDDFYLDVDESGSCGVAIQTGVTGFQPGAGSDESWQAQDVTAMQTAAAATLNNIMYGVKGRSGRKPKAATTAEQPASTAVEPTGAQRQPPQRGPGRPRVLPTGVAADPGSRMEQPGWSEMRESLAHRPRGFEPDFGAPGSTPQSFGPAQEDMQVMDSDQRDVRQQQLLHAWRTALQHLTIPNVSMALLCEGGNAAAAAASRWRTALAEVLNGRVNRRDEYHVACEAALANAVKRVLATAPPTLMDFRYQDMGVVFRHAVSSVLGIHLEQVRPSPIAPQPAQPFSMSVDMAQQRNVEAQTVPQLMPAHNPTGYANQSRVACDVHLSVQDLTARQPLQEADPELCRRRQAQAEYFAEKAKQGFSRPGTAMIDMQHTTVHVAGVPIRSVLYDSGCDIVGFSRPCYERVCAALKHVPRTGRISMEGIAEGAALSTLVSEPLTITFNQGTSWEVSVPWPKWVVLDNPKLPDVLIDTALARALQFKLISDGTAYYPIDPERGTDSPHAIVPLLDSGATMLSAARVHQWLNPAPQPMARAVGGEADGQANTARSNEAQADVNFSFTQQHEEWAGTCCRLQHTTCDEAVVYAGNGLVPDYGEQRQAVLDSGRRLPLSGYTQADLDAVGALPHTDPDKCYVLPLDTVAGRAGAIRAISGYTGMGTVPGKQLEEGVHFENLQLIEANADRREDLRKQLRLWNQRWPDRLPEEVARHAFDLSEAVGHDITQLTAETALDHMGHVDMVMLEPPCQDLSQLGMQLGLTGARTGTIVAVAAMLNDLQFLMAQRRGFAEWASAPAQFGFLMENVVGAPEDRRSPEVQQAYDFLNRVFGQPNLHQPHLCGDLSVRTAYWWTNMFTHGYYAQVEQEFHRAPPTPLAVVVAEASGGKLEPQIASKQRQHTLMGGLNEDGQPMRILPKFPARLDTVTQVLDPNGEPGAGMLRVVGSQPPKYVPAPARVRERCLNAPPGMYTRAELGRTEAQQCQAIGNVCAGTSAAVMLRIAVAYAHQRSWESWVATLSLTDAAEQAAVAAAKHRLEAAMRDRETTELDLQGAALQELRLLFLKRRKGKTRQLMGVKIMSKARQRKLQEAATRRRDAERKAAKARAKAAQRQRELRWAKKDPGVRQRVPSRQDNLPGRATKLLYYLFMVVTCCSIAFGVGSAIGAAVLSAAAGTSAAAQGTGSMQGEWKGGCNNVTFAANATESAELLQQCYSELGNMTFTGQAEETVAVPSRLKSTKDGTQHEWQIGASFGMAKELAKRMDQDPLNYAWGLHDLRTVKHEPVKFELIDENPVFRKQYHLAKREQDFADEWVKELEKHGLVKEIKSPWAAPVVVAPKKDETGAWNDLRYAIDYRGLNAKTVRDQYPTPVAEEILAKMDGATIFSCFDALKAFHQCKVDESMQPCMAFHAGNRLMTWQRLPFGQKNSVAWWQRVVDEALAGIPYAAAFADDIMVWSGDDEAEHIRRVGVVLEALRAKGVQLSPKKCHLGMRRIEFLGHVVSRDGVEPMWDKVQAICGLAAPKTLSELRSFLGMATYYCRFLPHYSIVKKPLTELTKKQVPYVWGAAQEHAFNEVKQLLTSAPVLRNPDWSKPFTLHTDWSKIGVGACLSQTGDDGVEYAIAYASRMNNNAESAFCSYEGEISAVVYAVQKFRYWLWGAKFTLICDNKAVEWLRSTARLRSKIARWSLILAEYDFDIKHRPGKDNTVPDLLSRQPQPPAVNISAGVAAVAWHLAQHPATSSTCRAAVTREIAAAMVAGCADAMLEWTNRDIWSSHVAVQFVKGELPMNAVSQKQWRALHQKCRRYQYSNGKLWRLVGKYGALKLEAPPPEERADIIMRTHHRIGHLGRDRTYSMVSRHYFWPGMHAQVGQVLKSCRECDRVRATFSMKHDRLKPMPLFGLFYRFGMDSAGPLRASAEGYTYVLVIVEHFSKWIDLVPVKSLNPEVTAKAFTERVLARYGAPVEVVTDNGQEYHGQFAALLKQHGIDQVEIPAGHPQTNGMSERLVQVLKEALRKFVMSMGSFMWDTWLPVIEFGYRMTQQKSTGFSPYFLLYGRTPISPTQIRSMLEEPVDVEDPQAMLELISQRADQIRAAVPKAYERALAAQRRDVVRYRKVRRGDVQPRTHRFQVGSYVYCAQPPINTLDVKTTRTILRVQKVYSTGWLDLIGADGRVITVHSEQCAPCNLSNLIPARRGPAMDGPSCKACGSDSTATPLVICDKCGSPWHTTCLPSGVVTIDPDDEWICQACQPPA